MSASRDFEELFGFLNARRVKALIIGAHAVAFHAKPRFTKDLDIFVEPSRENAASLLAALADFGFGGVGLNLEDFSSPGRIVQLGHPPNRVDLMTSIDGVDFDSAWRGRVAGRYGSAEVYYLGRDDLIRNKSASGRPQDQLDVAALEEPRSTLGRQTLLKPRPDGAGPRPGGRGPKRARRA